MKRGKKLIVLACALAAVLVLYLGVTLVTRHISDKNAVTETQGTFADTSFTADDIRSNRRRLDAGRPRRLPAESG